MTSNTLILIGASMAVFWGIAHLIPTKSVVKGFGDISTDNRRIITMEWVIEGITLIFIGVLAAATMLIDPTSIVSRVVYIISVIALLVLAAVSLVTGFKVKFLPYKLCPFIFTASVILILVGAML